MKPIKLEFSEFTTKSIEDTLKELKTSLSGLSNKEAEARLLQFGFNEIPSKKREWFEILFSQFKSSFVYLLLIAGFIAFVIGEVIDALCILFFIFINVVLSFIQEYRAEKTMQILKTFLPEIVRVMRNGELLIINKKYLVPGDIIELKAGDIISADARIIEAKNLLVDENILTGESKSISKHKNPLIQPTKQIFEAENILFSGTTIINGEAKAVVINNIKNSVIGKISKLVTTIEKKSVYEKELIDFSKLIFKMVLIFIVSVFFLRLLTNRENILDYLIFCVALIVSILPEALPTVVVFSLSQGAIKLAKKKVVVKRLAAIEALGNIKILCSDKTGTLTENKMFLEEIIAGDKEKILFYSVLSTDYLKTKIIDNSFDKAILEKVDKQFLENIESFKLKAENPFDLTRLINSTIVENSENKKLLIVKGAPEKIFEKTVKIEGNFSLLEIQEKMKECGMQGKRILALAYRELKSDEDIKNITDLENNLILLGLLVFVDPLKKTAKKTIQTAKKLGVRVKLITGDSREVAGYIGHQIGLIKSFNEVIAGKELEQLSEEEFAKKCEEINVFARISPEMKYKIIESLQKKYEVGFLGEGINDAPALKIANVAIAVNTAADISREVADIILLENDLKVIIEGIENGRKIFANLNKYIKTTLASNFGNFYSIAIISLFVPFLPMLPIQILLVNLLSDFPMIAVATDKVDAEELKRPKNYQMNQILPLIFRLALISTIFDFIFFGIFFHSGEKNLQTLWFVESILTELVLIFCIRTAKKFYQAIRPSYSLIVLGGAALLITIALPFANFGMDILHFQKPTMTNIILVVFLVILYFLASEATKLKFFKKHPVNQN